MAEYISEIHCVKNNREKGIIYTFVKCLDSVLQIKNIFCVLLKKNTKMLIGCPFLHSDMNQVKTVITY